MDLETLKRFSSGELPHKKFLAVHQEAGELLDLLYQNLSPSEYVASLQDWPVPRRKKKLSQFFALKTMMLFTPFVIITGTGLLAKDVAVGMNVIFGWLILCTISAVFLLLQRIKVLNSRDGKSVLVITNRRMLRVWLDGSEEVQSWKLGQEGRKKKPTEPVSGTTKLMIELELGGPSMN